MKRVELLPWDPADHLDTQEQAMHYLDAALLENDPRFVVDVLDDIRRSEAMTKFPPQAREECENLHKAVSANGEVEFGALLSVVQALGLQLRVEPAVAADCNSDAQPPVSRLRNALTGVFRRPAMASK
ncbi:MAG: putative addiction module antidote protein [Acidimicrobiaceae bacterium]|nr:putative addiction module antidote protein [Acidimicrobiaceae bacterium]